MCDSICYLPPMKMIDKSLINARERKMRIDAMWQSSKPFIEKEINIPCTIFIKKVTYCKNDESKSDINEKKVEKFWMKRNIHFSTKLKLLINVSLKSFECNSLSIVFLDKLPE